MGVTLITLGVVCVLGAIVGGGLKALGTEIPALASITRQLMLAVFGAILIVCGVVANQPSSPSAANEASPAQTTAIDPVACLEGDWLEVLKGRPDDASPNHWNFEPTGGTLTITRADNFIKGNFERNGALWAGTFTFGNGDVWKNVVLTPSPDCKLVQTNQQWYYKR